MEYLKTINIFLFFFLFSGCHIHKKKMQNADDVNGQESVSNFEIGSLLKKADGNCSQFKKDLPIPPGDIKYLILADGKLNDRSFSCIDILENLNYLDIRGNSDIHSLYPISKMKSLSHLKYDGDKNCDKFYKSSSVAVIKACRNILKSKSNQTNSVEIFPQESENIALLLKKADGNCSQFKNNLSIPLGNITHLILSDEKLNDLSFSCINVLENLNYLDIRGNSDIHSLYPISQMKSLSHLKYDGDKNCDNFHKSSSPAVIEACLNILKSKFNKKNLVETVFQESKDIALLLKKADGNCSQFKDDLSVPPSDIKYLVLSGEKLNDLSFSCINVLENLIYIDISENPEISSFGSLTDNPGLLIVKSNNEKLCRDLKLIKSPGVYDYCVEVQRKDSHKILPLEEDVTEIYDIHKKILEMSCFFLIGQNHKI